MPSKKEQKLRAKVQAARQQKQDASAATQHPQTDADSLVTTDVQILTGLLSSTVLESNKGALLIELNEKLGNISTNLAQYDRLKREQDKALMQGDRPSFTMAEVQRMVKTAVETAVAKVMMKVEDKQIEIDRLREELDVFKAQFPTKLDGGKKGKKIKLVSEEAFDDLNMQVAGHEVQLRKLQQEITNLKTENSNMRAREVTASHNVQALHAQVITLQQTAATMPPGVTVSTRLSTLENDIQRLQSIPSGNMHAGSLLSRIEELESDAGDCKVRRTSHEQKQDMLDGRIDRCFNAQQNAESALETKVTKVEMDVQAFRRQQLIAARECGRATSHTSDCVARSEHDILIEQVNRNESILNHTVDNFAHKNSWTMGSLAVIAKETAYGGFVWNDLEEKRKAEKACGVNNLPGRIIDKNKGNRKS